MTHYTIYFSGQITASDSFIRLAAADYTGISCDHQVILRGEHGKPYFADRDMPHFSLSHSGSRMACAVGPAPCGMDIQEHTFRGKKRNPAYLIRLAERYFHPDEAEYLKKSADTGNTFFDLWSARESYVKYTGEGITGDFSAFNILVPSDIAPARITKIPLAEDCSAFLCAEGDFNYMIKRI